MDNVIEQLKADDPEIVECEIRTDDYGDLVYKGNTASSINIDSVFHNPDFIGFKFEDGGVSVMPIGYGDLSQSLDCAAPEIAAKRVLHATHVLFRRKKKE